LLYKNGSTIQTSILNVVGILLGFTISILAIFITGNIKSIDEAKEYKTNIKLHNKEISLYTIIVIGLIYIAIINAILLIMNIIIPVFFEIFSFTGRILFSINIFLLLHSIISLITVVKDFYFIVTKNR